MLKSQLWHAKSLLAKYRKIPIISPPPPAKKKKIYKKPSQT